MRYIITLSLILTFAFTATGFGQNLLAREEAPARLYTVTHSGPKKKTLPPGFGREHVERSCVACHTTEIIRNKRHTLEEWRAIVNSMISLGALLEPEEAEVIIRYLSANFGPDDPYGI